MAKSKSIKPNNIKNKAKNIAKPSKRNYKIEV